MVILGNELIQQGRTRPLSTEWLAVDHRRIQRCALRVKNLEQSIKFYNQFFGFVVKNLLDVPGEIEQRALLSAGAAQDAGGSREFCLEVIESTDFRDLSHSSEPGEYFLHFTLAVESTEELINSLKVAGHGDLIIEERHAIIPIRSPHRECGGQTTQDIVSIVRDLDGYTWRISEMKRAGIHHRQLCAVAFHVTNLQETVDWLACILGTSVQHMYEASQDSNNFKTALVGFGPEIENVQLELRQNTTDPLPARHTGNGYVRLIITTTDLDKTMNAIRGMEGASDVEKTEIGSVVVPGSKETAVCISHRHRTDTIGCLNFCFVIG